MELRASRADIVPIYLDHLVVLPPGLIGGEDAKSPPKDQALKLNCAYETDWRWLPDQWPITRANMPRLVVVRLVPMGAAQDGVESSARTGGSGNTQTKVMRALAPAATA
jgi:hypothetical protein